ncbi:hypothetical protein HU200_061696 [Digitaria exilis]|uniref:WRKY domain-containing protein n=1 Tax=Digitaria exilis TaxID=1010633 RepID=A0A835E0K4_9POAL|nr:hypothetical protein HU200_061696 [Digitaria exilis]
MKDWMLPSSSPRTLMSSFLSKEFSSGQFSSVFSDNGSNRPQDGIEKSKTFVGSSIEETVQDTKAPLQLESSIFSADKRSTSPRCLAERMAARAGFGVLKIDTSRVSSSVPIRSPVTIPPGVSPRELLESPVFLPNAIVQPSPTTGKLPFLMPNNFKSMMSSVPEKAEEHSHDDLAFSFQPMLSSKPPSFSTADKILSNVQQNQSLTNHGQQELSLQANTTATKDETEENLVKPSTCDSMLDNDHPSPADEQEESEENHNIEDSSVALITPTKDGYNWRKYGQKLVKNSEYPRSYYRCTHPNCPVKKKVERSQEGHITEIVYKGSHNHPSPPPNHQPSAPLSYVNELQANGSENCGSNPGHNTEILREMASNDKFQDVHSGVLERKLPGSLTTTEIADTCVMESQEAVGVSSTLSSNEKDDRATHHTIHSTYHGDEDETESKRSVAPQASNLKHRPELAQPSIPQMSAAAAYSSRCLPPQLTTTSFGMLPPGTAIPVPSLRTFTPTPLPGHPPTMQGCTGLAVSRGEVNPEEQPRLQVANGTAIAAYHQFIGRLPQGPQM